MPHTGHHGAVVNLGIGNAFDDQKTGESPLHARQCVINDRVIPRHMKLELGDHSPAGCHGNGLNTVQGRVCQASQIVDLVEDLAKKSLTVSPTLACSG